MGSTSVLRRTRAVAAVLTVGLGLFVAGTSPAQASPGPTVELASVAILAPDGQSVTIDVTASCPKKWAVLEALITVSQPQTFGQAGISLTCTGRPQLVPVTVRSLDAAFQPGSAQASGFVLIERRGQTQQAQDSQVVLVTSG